MTTFYTDTIALHYSNVDAAKQWWIDAFGCKQEKVPQDWDASLPSDVALRFATDREPRILLSATAEVKQAGFDRPLPLVSIIFCNNLRKANDQLSSRGLFVSPIQAGGDMQFFEIRDIEGNLIQICKEP